MRDGRGGWKAIASTRDGAAKTINGIKGNIKSFILFLEWKVYNNGWAYFADKPKICARCECEWKDTFY